MGVGEVEVGGGWRMGSWRYEGWRQKGVEVGGEVGGLEVGGVEVGGVEAGGVEVGVGVGMEVRGSLFVIGCVSFLYLTTSVT